MNVCHIQALIAYKVALRTTLNEKLALMAKRYRQTLRSTLRPHLYGLGDPR